MKGYILRYWWMLLVGEIAVIAAGQYEFSRTNSYWDMIAAAKIADAVSLYVCIFVRSRIKRLTFRQAIKGFLTEHFLAGAFTGYCLEPFLFWRLPALVGITWALCLGKAASDLAFYPLSAGCREISKLRCRTEAWLFILSAAVYLIIDHGLNLATVLWQAMKNYRRPKRIVIL